MTLTAVGSSNWYSHGVKLHENSGIMEGNSKPLGYTTHNLMFRTKTFKATRRVDYVTAESTTAITTYYQWYCWYHVKQWSCGNHFKILHFQKSAGTWSWLAVFITYSSLSITAVYTIWSRKSPAAYSNHSNKSFSRQSFWHVRACRLIALMKVVLHLVEVVPGIDIVHAGSLDRLSGILNTTEPSLM